MNHKTSYPGISIGCELFETLLDFNFTDESYANDACARFESEDLILWVDCEDPAESEYSSLRESGTQKRFTLAQWAATEIFEVASFDTESEVIECLKGFSS